MSNKSIDALNKTDAGKAGLRRLRKAFGAVPKNFFFYSSSEVGSKNVGGLVLTGCEFRAAARGVTAGELTVRVPGTQRAVVVEV